MVIGNNGVGAGKKWEQGNGWNTFCSYFYYKGLKLFRCCGTYIDKDVSEELMEVEERDLLRKSWVVRSNERTWNTSKYNLSLGRKG